MLILFCHNVNQQALQSDTMAVIFIVINLRLLWASLGKEQRCAVLRSSRRCVFGFFLSISPALPWDVLKSCVGVILQCWVEMEARLYLKVRKVRLKSLSNLFKVSQLVRAKPCLEAKSALQHTFLCVKCQYLKQEKAQYVRHVSMSLAARCLLQCEILWKSLPWESESQDAGLYTLQSTLLLEDGQVYKMEVTCAAR